MGGRGAGRTERLRLFVALMFPDEASHHLDAQLRRWDILSRRHDARFARHFHITLKFLGEVASNRLGAIEEALRREYASLEPFSVTAGVLGAFPKPTRASVLWWGVEEGGDALREAAERTEAALNPLGFPRERRAFVPHITLARFRKAANLADWIDRENARLDPFPPFTATQLSLMRSELRRTGPLYTSLVAYPLDG